MEFAPSCPTFHVMGGSAVVSLKLPLGHVSVLEVVNNFIYRSEFLKKALDLVWSSLPAAPLPKPLRQGRKRWSKSGRWAMFQFWKSSTVLYTYFSIEVAYVLFNLFLSINVAPDSILLHLIQNYAGCKTYQ
jgi:hypothetical protein